MALTYRGGERTVEEARKLANASKGNGDPYLDSAVQMYKPRAGENIIRIMPPTWGNLAMSDKAFDKLPPADQKLLNEERETWGSWWSIVLSCHYSIGTDQNTYLCPRMIGQPCPICDIRPSLDPLESDALKPKNRFRCYLVDRKDEAAGVQAWAMPSNFHADVLSRGEDRKRGGLIRVDDPEEGFDLIFKREGEGPKTKYLGADIERDPSPISENDRRQEAIEDFIVENPLPVVLKFYDYEYLQKALKGQRPPEDKDGKGGTSRRGRGRAEEAEAEAPERPSRRLARDDVDEAPARSTRREEPEEATSRRSSREEVDEAPRSRRASREEPEEEETVSSRRSSRPVEEDEAPRRSRRAEPEDEPERNTRRSEEPERTTRRASREDEPEDESDRGARRSAPTEEESPRRRPVTAKRDPEPEPAEDSSASAREGLANLRRRRG